MFTTGTNVSAVHAEPQFAAGTKVLGHDGNIYKYVQYDAGVGSVAAVAGQVAYYGLDGYRLNLVTSDLSDSIEVGAGVLQSAPADGEYCWVQIKGPATLSIALTSGADGDPLTPNSGTDGTLAVVTAALDAICAYAGDASDNEIMCDFLF